MSERTFEPTARKLQQLREKGDIAISPDLTGAMTLLLAIYALAGRMESLMQGLVDLMRRSFSSLAGGAAGTALTPEGLHQGGLATLSSLSATWLPFMLTLVAGGALITLVQTRGLITGQRARPDLTRLNPFAGIKRIFSRQGFFETGKGLIKMLILGAVLYGAVRESPARIAEASLTGVRPAMLALGAAVQTVAQRAALVLLVIGGLDYVYKVRQYKQRAKMTREEVTEDMKNAEGQPLLKAKLRELQRRMSRGRMMQQVARADVIVTNPTHLAIALKYDSRTMAAPLVIAKGRDLVAQEIVRRARKHGVPIVQNIPLAHALIKVELDCPVPVALYHAVAEVLAFVYRIRPKTTYSRPVARPGTAGSEAEAPEVSESQEA